jgi:hypothetical protein
MGKILMRELKKKVKEVESEWMTKIFSRIKRIQPRRINRMQEDLNFKQINKVSQLSNNQNKRVQLKLQLPS